MPERLRCRARSLRRGPSCHGDNPQPLSCDTFRYLVIPCDTLCDIPMRDVITRASAIAQSELRSEPLGWNLGRAIIQTPCFVLMASLSLYVTSSKVRHGRRNHIMMILFVYMAVCQPLRTDKYLLSSKFPRPGRCCQLLPS